MALEGFDLDCVRQVRARLEESRLMGVSIGFAIESGSRAWGFPSPDSDYDCRFVYVQPIAAHLSLTAPRDVIEFPIIGDIDAGGWDLRKALNLALAGNAVVNEWARSIHVYEELDDFRAEFLKTLNGILEPDLVANHYVGLALNQLKLLGSLDGQVKLKKLFYLLRPLFCLQWMEERNFVALPPMNIHELMADCCLPTDVVESVQELIALKAVTKELGLGDVPPAISSYAMKTLEAMQMRVTAKATHRDERRIIAEEFYRQWVVKLDH